MPNLFQAEHVWDYLVAKWGQPKNLGQVDSGEFSYTCLRCGAGWVGPNGDYCYWCHKRWLIQQADLKQALLFPEWLGWDDSYFRLGKEGQAVWENTRGYNGNFVDAWRRRAKRAEDDGFITEAEMVLATGRVKKWIERLP